MGAKTPLSSCTGLEKGEQNSCYFPTWDMDEQMKYPGLGCAEDEQACIRVAGVKFGLYMLKFVFDQP